MKKLILITTFLVACAPGKVCLYQFTIGTSAGESFQAHSIDTQYSYCDITAPSNTGRVSYSRGVLVHEDENTPDGRRNALSKIKKGEIK